MVPVSLGQPSRDKVVCLKPSSVHSALLSKLSNGISQRKARGAPVLVPSSRLEQFNIGQFASMSSRKIGLVVQAVPKLQVAPGRKAPEKVGTMPNYENAAYQQVIRQFPNLAKSVCKEEDLLKMAVAPDDVLECLPTVVSKTPVEDHVLHDHDYCVRGFPVKGSASLLQGDGRLLDDIDREPKLGRPPKNGDRRKKATKRTLEGLGSRANSPGGDSTQQILPPSADTKSNPELKLEGEVKSVQAKRRSARQKSGHDSLPSENPDSPDIDGHGDGAKVKITGAFQDDFVYFINKTSRNRRRASEQPQVPAAPVVQASDIYIPHLSDADIAALKNKTAVGSGSTGQTNITDEDSKVINTILSMETSLERTETTTDGFGFATPGGDALNGLDLTPEQMDILFSAINGDPSVQKFSQENFGLGPEVELPQVPVESVDPGKTIPVSQAGENFTDASSHLLGNVDNLHMPNMDLILSTTSSLKSNLPTLDPSEVQDSISAIASTSSSVTSLDTGLETIPSTVDSTVMTPQTHEFSVTAVSAEPKPAPLNGMSDLALPPFDKSLDFLGVGDMKTDLFPEMGLSQENSATSEANSPWIVTVSMYWNDLPAIMLGNQPYVRLVDIYKQILPAKDTGILKKRCQLLGMEVKNCSEMQRYFLVKYGRGYNSKSTLVVSKDDAKRLIGFYVEPQSRTAKPEGAVEKMPGSPLPAPKFRKPASEASCDSTTSGSVSPGLTKDGNSSDPPSLTAKKDKPKSASPRTPSKRRMVSSPAGESVSKRLRHKKINFRSMLQGIKREDEVMEGESPLSPAMPSDLAPQSEGEACPANIQTDPCMPSRRRSRSQSDSIDKTLPPQTEASPVLGRSGDKIIPVRLRSYGSRANLKSPRSHSFGLLKPCSLRQYNLLGKQLRRVKGSFPTNGTLQNVLKKRQLNGTLPVSPIKPGDMKTGVPEVDVKQLRSELSPLAEDRPIQGNLNSSGVSLRRGSSRRRVVASSAAGNRVRSSGRKRKLKQLYPIENYSYTKKARKEAGNGTVCVQPTPLETSRHLRGRPIVPVRTSPRKKRVDMNAHIEADGHVVATSRSTSEDEENRPKNVITLTNGPEFETFTALTGDFSV
ncbi:uncharacterized protein LOC135467613 [Liolophura sinensis]|uniref:uncharacterized protein LOC135467613 n=1 Tax=Liolophura sinensis TaxID=3198878 RepID=UPI00315825C2